MDEARHKLNGDRGRDATVRPTGRRIATRLTVLLLGAVLAGCSASAPRPSVATETPAQPRQTPSGNVPPNAVPSPVHPVGDPVVLASGLDAPWSILRLAAGTLISERDTALVRELLPDGELRNAAEVADVRPGGEGGLLGLAFLPDAAAPGGAGWVYAYFTAAADNEIVRMPLSGTSGSLGLGAPEPVLSGIPKAGNHDGGRLGIGPDGMLYATAGDAGDTRNAQDLGSLGGKILRMTPTGKVPGDNPFGTLVYSFGHRNPQGIAWDSRGRLWASEFGQNTWDELNLIVPGGNYGWPVVEGAAGNPAYRDPAQQWRTSEASPSGLAIVNDTLFMAALRGERLWRIDPSTGETSAWFANSFGRLRDVVSGPDGTLWFVSNNTDGRGDRAPGDDKLYQVRVAP